MFVDISNSRFVCVVFSSLVCFSSQCWSAEFDNRPPRDRLLADYPEALRRLEEQYRCESGRAVLSSTARTTGEKSREEIQFACDLSLSRTIGMERAASPKGYKEVVRCSNASYSFKLQRNSSDLPYVISDVVDGTQRVDEFGRFYFDGYLAAPYLAFGRPIREIMERPDLGFKLLDVSEVTDVGRQFLKMAFEFRLAPNFPLAPAWIELDPEYGWAVHRFEGRFGPKQISRGGSVEYSGMERGRPVVRRVIHWSPTAEDTMDVTEIEFDRHPDPRDFTLSAFGLPEVNQKPGDARAIPLNYWLFGFGAVALALAILIRRSTRRRPASSVGQSV